MSIVIHLQSCIILVGGSIKGVTLIILKLLDDSKEKEEELKEYV